MYEKQDIVLLKPTFGDKQVVITGLNPNHPKNKYKGRVLGGRSTKTYVLSDDIIVCKVGRVESNHPFFEKQEADTKSYNDINNLGGESLNLSETEKYVRSLIPNNSIKIRRRNDKIEQWTFGRFLPRGQKYKFIAMNKNGTSYKFQLKQVVVPV